jgi:hypothetical protein
LKDNWKDGSTKWDVWSLAAMILEADLKVNSFFKVKNVKEALDLAVKHLSDRGTSSALKLLIEKVLMPQKKENEMTIDELSTIT